VTGGVVPLLSGLRTNSGGWDSDAFAVSSAGHLVSMPGFVDYGGRKLMTADREGRVEELSRQERPYDHGLAYSPDGRWVAVGVDDKDGVPQLWLLDLTTGAQSPVSRENQVALGSFVWSPDASRLAWTQWKNAGESALWWRPTDRSEEPTPLVEMEAAWLRANSWSPDGAWLAFQKRPADAGRGEVWLLAVDGSGETRQLLAAPRAEFGSLRFSPDGRWIAYVSDESGKSEVYVRGFDRSGTVNSARYPISNDGGNWPGVSRITPVCGSSGPGDAMPMAEIFPSCQMD
jgi:Tol biopolymer transport system component